MSGRKVLYVIDSLDRFGATLQLDLLSREVVKTDEVHIAVLASGGQTPIFMEDTENPRTFHFLSKHDCFQDSFRALAASAWKLGKLIRAIRPTVIHAFCSPAETAMLAASKKYDSARKFVSEFYVRPSSNMTREAMDQFLAKDANQYFVSHEEIRNSLVQHQYLAGNITVIPNAAAAEKPVAATTDKEPVVSARQKLVQLVGKGSDIRIAGAVAPLIPRSRLKDLIWATDLLTCIRDDFHFVIFGRGSQRKRLERFAFQTEAGHHVHFIDSEVEAYELIPGLDFFWQSHLNESLPAAMHHAMSSAIPVVTVYGPGVSESIEHQSTGFATNFGARDEFARWTKYLLEKTDSAARLGKQGKESLEGKTTAQDVAAKVLDYYDAS